MSFLEHKYTKGKMTVGNTTDKTTWDATSIVFNPLPPIAAATIAAGITPIQRVTILRRNG